MLEHALRYASQGFYVFPVWWPVNSKCACGAPDCTAPAKHPVQWLVSKGKSDATRDESLIRSWWQRAPDANIGISTAPSNLIVLDVDVAGQKQGRASLATIDDQLTETLTAITGSGGIHAYYQRGDLEPFQRIGALPGIDLIGNGYVIAPPSLHASGNRYTWANQARVAIIPTVLVTLKQAHAEKVGAADVGKTPIEQGSRNNALFRLGAALRNTGINRDALRAALRLENRERFKPALGDEEVEAVAASVMARVHPQFDAALSAVVAKDMRELFGNPTVGQSDSSAVPAAALAHELVASLMRDTKLPVVHLPFPMLDEKLGGLSQHSTTVIVAGTGKGKSSLAGQIATHHALKFGPAIYYVGEMTRTQVMARIVGQILKRSWLEILHGHVPENVIREAVNTLPIYFVQRSENPVVAMIEACKRAIADGHTGTPMVIVDYVQLLASVSKEMRISTMQAVRDLQMFAETAPIVMLVLSQSSRGGATRIREGAGEAEELGDTGAETAEIERSATNQLVLSFASKDGAETHDVTMMVSKSRFGGGHKLGFEFNGKTGIWTQLARPPASVIHEDRCNEIIAELEKHEAGKCQGGVARCGYEFTQNLLSSPKKAHHIAGTKAAVSMAIKDLIDMRRIVRVGQVLLLAK